MAAAGVKVSLGAFFDQPRYAPQYAGNLVSLNKVPGASGLSWGQAFAAISSVPAEISGMGGKAGVLKAGALGDVVLWTGDPLEVGSVPTRVFIGGVEQDLTNHQTRLRDRYRTLDEIAGQQHILGEGKLLRRAIEADRFASSTGTFRGLELT